MIGLSHSRSPNAAVLGSDAVWILHASEVCGNGGVWGDGVSCWLFATKVRPTHPESHQIRRQTM